VEAEWVGPDTRFNLELPADRDALSQSAQTVLGQCEGLVILDEVQRLPELFTLPRPLCDRPDRSTRFLLLGSASWEMVKGVSESLAGRIQFVDVSGFSLAETGAESLHQLWFRGGFHPAFLSLNDAEAMERHGAVRRIFWSGIFPTMDSWRLPRHCGASGRCLPITMARLGTPAASQRLWA
jgi:predicted AAA+ superfamily ATPase